MLAAVLATVTAASTVALPNQAAPAEAAPNDVIAIVLEGTGNGHGRGMSQWGAYGWAVEHGWSWEQILDWYYGGTGMGDFDVNSRMTVRLLGMDGAGSVGVVSYAGGVTWNGQTLVSMRAVKNPTGAYFDVYGSGAATCAADVYLGSAAVVSFTTPTGEVSNSSSRDAIGVCEPNGSITHYRGQIDVSVPPEGVRVVNNLRTEDYLRGVVPREVAASWADAGGGAGANAVRAQAVAARSYALAQNRYSYAKTCDTTACQAYDGTATRATIDAQPVLLEDNRSNLAVAATAGQDPAVGQRHDRVDRVLGLERATHGRRIVPRPRRRRRRHGAEPEPPLGPRPRRRHPGRDVRARIDHVGPDGRRRRPAVPDLRRHLVQRPRPHRVEREHVPPTGVGLPRCQRAPVAGLHRAGRHQEHVERVDGLHR